MTKQIKAFLRLFVENAPKYDQCTLITYIVYSWKKSQTCNKHSLNKCDQEM